MMATDHRPRRHRAPTAARVRLALLGVLPLALASVLAAPAASTARLPGLGIVDARTPQVRVRVDAVPASGLVPYLRLSDPDAHRVECCLRVLPDAQGGRQADAPSDTLAGSLLRYDTGTAGADAAPVPTRPAQRLSAAEDSPFIGLVLPPAAGARVLARSAHELRLQWFDTLRARPVRALVQHCLSREGLHIWWQRTAPTPSRRVHHYLPLGQEVEADCPRGWLQR